MAPEKIDIQVLATSLMGAVGDTFQTMCSEKFSQDPTGEPKPIEFEAKDRMKASAYSKVYVSAYISYIHYYLNMGDKKRNKPCGTVVLYVKDVGIIKLLPALGYKHKDYTKVDLVKDMVGELCNNIAGGLKNELGAFGYNDLEMSTPINNKDLVDGGILVPKKQTEEYEVGIYLWDSKPVVIDVVLGI